MHEQNEKRKSRLGRNLSALLNHSEESLFKAMQLKQQPGDNGHSDPEAKPIPAEVLTFQLGGADQGDTSLDLPVLDEATCDQAEQDQSDFMSDMTPEEERPFDSSASPQSVISRITLKQNDRELGENDLQLRADEAFELSVAVHLPLLSKNQSIPPVVSKLHVYLLINEPVTGARLRMETSSIPLDPKRKRYEINFPIEGVGAGAWDLCVHIYVALYAFSERKVLNLLLE
jgi:hypothetical protein